MNNPEGMNDAAHWWSVRLDIQDPNEDHDPLELVLREENLGTQIYPYGWEYDYYIPLLIRTNNEYRWSLSEHIHEKDGNQTKKFFITVKTRSPWSINANYGFSKEEAIQMLRLTPKQILEAFQKPRQ
jgi:hypothetical protein